jgi:hypothetical protein
MPKPEKIEDLSIKGKTPKKMIKVVKPEKKGFPDIANKMAELAKKKAESGEDKDSADDTSDK